MNHLSPIVVDCETAPLLNAREFIDAPDVDDIEAPKNYVKPEAIAEYIAREKAKRMADYEFDCTNKAALDFNVARVVALGWWSAEHSDGRFACCEDEAAERDTLKLFWQLSRQRTIVGFRIREFDLPLMVQRSRYLGIDAPTLDFGRYARGSRIVDLYDLLTFQDMRQESVMRRTVKSFARRFGIPVTDTIDGSHIPELVAAGQWDLVADHVLSDVRLELALARRLGVVQPAPVEAVL